MTWRIESTQPSTLTAVYFFALPVDNVILWAEDLTSVPTKYNGDLRWFLIYEVNDRPVIPLDMHNAICLNWLQPYELARNMEYIDDSIRAAVALVA